MKREEILKELSKFRVIECTDNLDSIPDSVLELKLKLLTEMSYEADKMLNE